jgi:hypothetical protein
VSDRAAPSSLGGLQGAKEKRKKGKKGKKGKSPLQLSFMIGIRQVVAKPVEGLNVCLLVAVFFLCMRIFFLCMRIFFLCMRIFFLRMRIFFLCMRIFFLCMRSISPPKPPGRYASAGSGTAKPKQQQT